MEGLHGEKPRVSWNNTIVVHTYNKDGTNKKTLEVEDRDNMRGQIRQAISEDKFAQIQKKVFEKWGLLDNEVYVKWKLVNNPASEASTPPPGAEASTSSAQQRRAYKLRQQGKDERLVYIESEPAASALRRKAQSSTCPVTKKSFILRQRGKQDKVIHMELEDQTTSPAAQVAPPAAPPTTASIPRIPEERTPTPPGSEASSNLSGGLWTPVTTPVPAHGAVMRPPTRSDHQVLFDKFNQSLDQIPEVDLNPAPPPVQRHKDSSLPNQEASLYERKSLEQTLSAQKRDEEMKSAQQMEDMSRMRAALVQAEANLETQRQQWEKEKASIFATQKKEKSSLIAALTQAHKDLMTERKAWQDEKSSLLTKHEKEKAGLIVALDRAHKDLMNERREWQKERASLQAKQQKEKASLLTALDQAIKDAMKERNGGGKRSSHFWQTSRRMCPI